MSDAGREIEELSKTVKAYRDVLNPAAVDLKRFEDTLIGLLSMYGFVPPDKVLLYLRIQVEKAISGAETIPINIESEGSWR